MQAFHLLGCYFNPCSGADNRVRTDDLTLAKLGITTILYPQIVTDTCSTDMVIKYTPTG